MSKYRYRYIVRLQYLGFRYSGWQIQPKHKTISGMLEKTFVFLFPDQDFKILGAGRTDAKVSALDAAFELFLINELPDLAIFLKDFNKNLPSDIRLVSIEPVGEDFNIIKDSKIKEYLYFFSFGTKNHPFSAPFITNYIEPLNLDLMKEGATLFQGKHDFSVFTTADKTKHKKIRTITSCSIIKNTLLEANFFPDNSYILKIHGEGFMRYQIRLIMGALVQLGRNELTLDQIKSALQPGSEHKLTSIAPGSGLLLNQVNFKG
ncbi:tRNA pseudouridine38-40 synthase [Maribacter sedimenticola]|uniref:tRNA pseudouridine synthase A n=1 Tax=Maribacter sedimenticola TaxID=228956 RepID=A0ABY1SGU7_9FLAO|nr:tRNA pseudouridine(38-40) synthase TruA [Maribacter sedimenticola]SNR47324.1 tRNA pseudouridine38-40 synthase [Maribacter sedimenticola]